jgi:hypothetical protein
LKKADFLLIFQTFFAEIESKYVANGSMSDPVAADNCPIFTSK